MKRPMFIFNIPLLFLFAILLHGLTVSAETQAGNVGINGKVCAYSTVASAIAAASNGATIYIMPSVRTEFIGTIDKSLTFVPARAGSDCQFENTGADSQTVIFQANGFSQGATGGLVHVMNSATVTFRHMSFRDALATNGGVMAVTDGARVFLDDADVYDGLASSNGGGIYVLDGVLVLSNGSTVRQNSTEFGSGGGIAVYNGVLTINDGSIGGTVAWENYAKNDGGGIYANNSTLTLRGANSIIGFNSADHNGGGIGAIASTVNITDLDINTNTAYANGGGIYIEDSDSTLTVTNAKVRNNSTTNSITNQGGGGIWANSGVTGVIDNTLIESNDSDNLGGGVGWRSSGSLDVINNSQIFGNSADASGGGLYVVTSVDLTITDSELTSNSTGHSGGAFYLLGGSLLMDNAEMFNNVGDWGGAMRFAFVDDIDISNSFISGNSAIENGGAIYADDVQMVMTDTIFTLNQAGPNGGTVWFGDPDSTWQGTGVTISGSETTTSSTNQGGGCIYIEDALWVNFETFHADSCDSQNLGGGFFIENGAPVSITNGFIGYSTGTSGGGFYIVHADVTLDNVEIANNEARSHNGAGIYSFGVPSDLIIRNSRIRDNTANIHGGGVYAAYGKSLVENTLIYDNHAENSGGGIYATQGEFTIRSLFANEQAGGCDPSALAANVYCTEVRGNSADKGGGIAVVGDFSPPTTYDTDFSADAIAILENSATTNGSAFFTDQLETASILANVIVRGNTENYAVHQDGPTDLTIANSSLVGNPVRPLHTESVSSTLTMTNTIIWENIGGPYVRFGANFTRSCNDSQGQASGSQSMGSINQDPIFVSTARGDYRLHASSPAINACNNGMERDADGFVRAVGGSYDMGAFEQDGVLVPTAVTVSLQETMRSELSRGLIIAFLFMFVPTLRVLHYRENDSI